MLLPQSPLAATGVVDVHVLFYLQVTISSLLSSVEEECSVRETLHSVTLLGVNLPVAVKGHQRGRLMTSKKR